MRILELGKFYPPHFGGIESLLKAWSEGFARMGAQVDCVAANESFRTVVEEINGVRVRRCASLGQALSTSICPGYVRAARKIPADVWHSHFPNPLADLACLAGPLRAPLIVHYHSDVIRQSFVMRWYGPLLQRVLRRAARIVVATPKHIEHSPWLRPVADKCEIIPFGTNLARFALTPEISERAQSFRAREHGRPIVLTIGRLVGYKGHAYLIEAMRELRAALWIAGIGPLENELKAQASAAGIGDRIRFLGAVPDADLPALLHACDIFALPSITANEAFGMVQIEAMACCKPVVSCDLRSGVPFVNQHGTTGLIVPPADSRRLAEALKELLTNATLRDSLGAAAGKRAREEFDERVMLSRYWQLVNRVVKQ